MQNGGSGHPLPPFHVVKPLWRGSAPNASPGGKLSENRLFGTDPLTEEECGR